jgi:hypothetical protein
VGNNAVQFAGNLQTFQKKLIPHRRVILYPKDEDICFFRNVGKIVLRYTVIFISHRYDGLKSLNIIWLKGNASYIGPPCLLAHKLNVIK